MRRPVGLTAPYREDPEEEEFNRIEMESRVRKEYIRSLPSQFNQKMGDDKVVMMADYLHIMEQLAHAKVQIRELQKRITKLEAK